MTPTELWLENQERTKRLVYQRANLTPTWWKIIDDLMQSALMNLWIAANKYQEERANNGMSVASFFTYAYPRIKGGLVMESWRHHFFGIKARRQKIKVSVTEKVEELPVSVPDSVPEDMDLVEYIINQLPSERWQMIARRKYVEGLQQKTIAHQMGISETRVNQMMKVIDAEMMLIVERLKKEWGE